MLLSARTQELARSEAALEKKKRLMSEKFQDEEEEIEYCKRKLAMHEEKKSTRNKSVEAFQKRILVDQVYEDIDQDEEDGSETGPTEYAEEYDEESS